MAEWWLILAVLVLLGAVSSRSRATGRAVFAIFIVGMALASVAIYLDETGKESQVDPMELDAFNRENPFTPGGVVVLFGVICGVPWLSALALGWAGGKIVRRRHGGGPGSTSNDSSEMAAPRPA